MTQILTAAELEEIRKRDLSDYYLARADRHSLLKALERVQGALAAALYDDPFDGAMVRDAEQALCDTGREVTDADRS